MSAQGSAATRSPEQTDRLVLTSACAAAVLAVVVSVVGLTAPGTYQLEPVVTAALRGGDAVTLAVGPAVVWMSVLAARGSVRARLVLTGLLGYLAYSYGYYVFTPTFSDLFLLHIAALVAAVLALIVAALSIDVQAVTQRSARVPVRVVAGVLLAVVAAMVWVEASGAVGFMLTGEQPQDVLPAPEWRVHLGYALDLAVVAPAGLIAGILLWRRHPKGLATAVVATVGLAVYQFNFMATNASVAGTGVAGVTPVDPKPLITATIFTAMCLALLLPIGAAPDRPTKPGAASPPDGLATAARGGADPVVEQSATPGPAR